MGSPIGAPPKGSPFHGSRGRAPSDPPKLIFRVGHLYGSQPPGPQGEDGEGEEEKRGGDGEMGEGMEEGDSQNAREKGEFGGRAEDAGICYD